MTKVINLWAGPGTGKSTVAADLFAEMKWEGHSVELVSEYAKKVTWEGHHNILSDQLYISAKQNRKIEPLIGQVDWVITDSPLLMCEVYIPSHYKPSFFEMVKDFYNQYDNINVFLERQKKYVAVGRNQTEEQARALDQLIRINMLDMELDFIEIPANREAKFAIMRHLGLK